MTPASSSTTPTGAGVLRKESNSGTPTTDQPPAQTRMRTWSALSSRGNSRDKGDEAGAASSSSFALTETPASTSTKISSRATSLLNLFVPSNNSGAGSAGGAQNAPSSSASASQGSLGVAFGFPSLGDLTVSYIFSYRGFPSFICFRRRSRCEETFQSVAVADTHSRGG